MGVSRNKTKDLDLHFNARIAAVLGRHASFIPNPHNNRDDAVDLLFDSASIYLCLEHRTAQLHKIGGSVHSNKLCALKWRPKHLRGHSLLRFHNLTDCAVATCIHHFQSQFRPAKIQHFFDLCNQIFEHLWTSPQHYHYASLF
mgnify:CR=1 FL=1